MPKFPFISKECYQPPTQKTPQIIPLVVCSPGPTFRTRFHRMRIHRSSGPHSSPLTSLSPVDPARPFLLPRVQASWVTLLNLTGEYPLGNYTWLGRCISSISAVFAISVFAIPTGMQGLCCWYGQEGGVPGGSQ